MHHLDVQDLLSRLGIPFRKSGAKLLANCPARAHADTTQRWMIRDERSDPRSHARHRCLSCGFGGGPVGLVMEHLQCSRADAIAFLTSSERGAPVRLEVEVEVRPAVGAVQVPPEVQFCAWEEWAPTFRDYLEERDVGPEQVERWGIGYIDQASAKTPMLRRRIWLPVRDHLGRLAGWTARTITKNAQPKYLSSSRADGASQSALLGEHLWPPYAERDTLVVVEGPFDALAVDRAGYSVAALRGSDLDPGQAQKLSTWRRLLVAVDPDAAGYKASIAINGLRRHMEVCQVVLTPGEDVADLAVRDPEQLALALSRAGLSDHGRDAPRV